jgi:putative membrane protein
MNDTSPKEHHAGPDLGTQLALDRTYLADERTLMAWVRTSLSMISFGFTLSKLGQILQDVQFRGLMGVTRTVSMKELAYLLVILGTLALLAASFQHWRRVRELHSMGYARHFSVTFVVALALAAVGGFALTSMILSI